MNLKKENKLDDESIKSVTLQLLKKNKLTVYRPQGDIVKKALIFIIVSCSLIGGGVLAKTYMDRGEFMSLEAAKKKWGNVVFEANTLKTETINGAPQ